MFNLKRNLIAITLLLVFDFIWISLNYSRYNTLVANVQGSKMNTKILSAIVAYTLMIIGLLYIVFPLMDQDKSKNALIKALKYGGLFGLVVYGIYNFTNYAIFDNYSLFIGLTDTLWGTFVYFIVTYIALYIK